MPLSTRQAFTQSISRHRWRAFTRSRAFRTVRSFYTQHAFTQKKLLHDRSLYTVSETLCLHRSFVTQQAFAHSKLATAESCGHIWGDVPLHTLQAVVTRSRSFTQRSCKTPQRRTAFGQSTFEACDVRHSARFYGREADCTTVKVLTQKSFYGQRSFFRQSSAFTTEQAVVETDAFTHGSFTQRSLNTLGSSYTLLNLQMLLSLRYTTFHYSTTTLYYTSIALHKHFPVLLCTTMLAHKYTPRNYFSTTRLALKYTSLQYTTLHCTTLQLHFTTLLSSTFLCSTLQLAQQYTSLQYITVYYRTTSTTSFPLLLCNYKAFTKYFSATLHFATLH